ncbi:MAG: DUF86 domain-containing protein [Acidimicrobiia bacterium]
MTPADRRRLLHILDHIERIRRYTSEGRTAYDDKTQDAVIHCLTVIGEAAGALSQATYDRIAALPPKAVRAQRNILVHEYWRIDHDIVWATVQHDLPKLTHEIRELLAAER